MLEDRIIPGYSHKPGFHCASSAIRNILAFRGIQITEPDVIGLGRGPGFYYQVLDQYPSRLVHVRCLTLEENFFSAAGIPFKWRETEDPAEATRLAKDILGKGLPILIQTNIAYLSYFHTDQHFPGHSVVICGYDGEKGEFYVSDTLRPDFLAVAVPDMERARSTGMPPYILRNQFFVLEDVSGFFMNEDTVRGSIRLWAGENLHGIPGLPAVYGIRSLERLILELPEWKEAADWQWSARFTYQIIERRGTGGAGFRILYRQFLEAQEGRYPALQRIGLSKEMSVIEGIYHDVAAVFRQVSERDVPDFSPAMPVLEKLLERERAFYQKILLEL